MKQVAVDPVRTQPAQGRLTGPHHATPRRVARHHLGDEKDLLPAIGHGFGDDGFRLAIHLGGIDVGHAGIDPGPQGAHGLRALAAVDPPRTLSDDGHGDARRPEAPRVHAAASPVLPLSRRLAVRLTRAIMAG